MGTSYYNCGCSVSTSMFGERDVLSVTPCVEHALKLQNELKALSAAMGKIINENNENNLHKGNKKI